MAETAPTDDVRHLLEEERDHLRAQLTELGVAEYDENFADSGQVAAEQGENRALVNQLADTLSEVEKALVKLDSNAYGLCEVCGASIGEDRLEAMPAAPTCINCASGRS